MNKLILESVTIRNFKSFGDYDTTVNLRHRGPTLIVGSVDENEHRSNGAGKSTLVEAIIWCLFGRLSDIHNPGDKIINWVVGKDCIVSLDIEGGYKITRTRKYKDHSDLLITKDGIPIENGDSTNANAQKTLNQMFELDFGTFISSIYFGQFSGSFINLSDPKKKEIVEKLFGITKLRYYADVTKKHMGQVESDLNTSTQKLFDFDKHIDSSNQKLELLSKNRDDYEQKREAKITELQSHVQELQSQHNQELIDIEELEQFWKTVDIIRTKLSSIDNYITSLLDERDTVKSDIANLKADKSKVENHIFSTRFELQKINDHIELIRSTEGSCPTCEQDVSESLIEERISTYKNNNKERMQKWKVEIDKLLEMFKSTTELIKEKELQLSELDKKIAEERETKKNVEHVLQSKKFERKTINEAKSHNEVIKHVNKRVEEYQSLISETSSADNPYDAQIQSIKDELETIRQERDVIQSKIDELHDTFSHLKFIYKAYAEKKNIRAFIISGYIPILNNRLSYYLSALGIQSDIEFNNMLQMKSSQWDYATHSGGEKKRVDLSLMCALYDTHITMYGAKTNILVLDEIDKELDRDGVDDYVRLIMDDLSHRVESPLVISHKNEINYAFPSQIKLNKEDGFSYVHEE